MNFVVTFLIFAIVSIVSIASFIFSMFFTGKYYDILIGFGIIFLIISIGTLCIMIWQNMCIREKNSWYLFKYKLPENIVSKLK